MGDNNYQTWISSVATLAGLWAIVSPFVLGASGIWIWNNVLTGAIIAGLAGFLTMQVGEDSAGLGFLGGFAVLAGVWLAAAPFVFAVTASLPIASNILTGLVIVLAIVYVVYDESSVSRSSPSRPTT